jgi:hypothetical protein
VDELALGSQIAPFADGQLRGCLPDPAACELVVSELPAGPEIGQPPAAPNHRTGDPRGGEGQRHEQPVPPLGRDAHRDKHR